MLICVGAGVFLGTTGKAGLSGLPSLTGTDERNSAVASRSTYPRGTVRQRLVDTSRLSFQADAFEFGLIADLDQASRNPAQFSWHSFFKLGTLRKVHGKKLYKIEWGETKKLESSMSIKNRSMELSELVAFEHLLLAVCDITGLIFKIDRNQHRVFQRWAIADGNGEEVKPFKMEWATVKDERLYVGSMGREWVDDNGDVIHVNSQWVKTIDRNGRVENINWRPVYEALRTATNTTRPGYLWHEAVHWDVRSRRWILLPRKASFGEPYSPESDETRGTNLLLIASEDFSDIIVRRIGPLEPEYGFSAVRKVPGTDDVYMALKVLEIGTKTSTKITVFDLDGNFLLDPPFVHVDDLKYEGVDFLGEQGISST